MAQAKVMPRVCIVEAQGHPAPGTLGRRLAERPGFTVRTVAAVPDQLDNAEALVLNNIPSAPDSVPEDRILRFIEAGGGVFAVHDTVYPYAYNKALVATCGIRPAYGAMQRTIGPNGPFTQIILAVGDQSDPTSRFPVKPVVEGVGHPILDGVREFELAEEVWAQNLAPGVRPLMAADVGDRVFAPERFQRGPMPVAACRTFGEGRLAWFSLGHFAEVYGDPNFVQFVANALRWVTKETNERQYQFDLFLSFSSQNRDQARAIVQAAEAVGLTIFQDEKNILPGAVWAEEIRQALMNSREMALLASPESLVSEWVQTEWGAAWVLQRTITPILLMVAPDQLSERLRQSQAVIYGEHQAYLEAVRDRARG
jgi:Trehalose utilisation/TIR domain